MKRGGGDIFHKSWPDTGKVILCNKTFAHKQVNGNRTRASC